MDVAKSVDDVRSVKRVEKEGQKKILYIGFIGCEDFARIKGVRVTRTRRG
jgi:hypothetical protein